MLIDGVYVIFADDESVDGPTGIYVREDWGVIECVIYSMFDCLRAREQSGFMWFERRINGGERVVMQSFMGYIEISSLIGNVFFRTLDNIV